MVKFRRHSTEISWGLSSFRSFDGQGLVSAYLRKLLLGSCQDDLGGRCTLSVSRCCRPGAIWEASTEPLHRLVGNPRQPSRGRCCSGAIAVAVIPLGPYYRHSSEHTLRVPREKRWGMKQRRVHIFIRCFLCSKRPGLEAKRGCPAHQRLEFCSVSLGFYSLGWGFSSFICCCFFVCLFSFLRVLIVECFYTFCGLAFPPPRAVYIRTPAGCVRAGGPGGSVGAAGPGRTGRFGSGRARPAPVPSRGGCGATRALTAAAASSQSERGSACRQPMSARRWRPAVAGRFEGAMAEPRLPGPQGHGRESPAAGAGPRDRAGQAEDVPREDAESDWSADSWSDYGSRDKPGTALGRTVPDGNVLFPDIFHTDHLLFYERFSAYQDYILADCKASEVKQFIAEYLEKVLEPCGWQAIWRTDVFQVLVGVVGVNFPALKAVVQLSEPFLCESQDSSFTQECMQELLELKEHQILLQELWVVYDESGEFDQTALAIEHLRFFYRSIWRTWDEEEEDEFDYFVRCVEPRLRLHYDILEQRVPSGLVLDYQNLLSQCEKLYEKFLNVRNSISSNDSDSEAENVSMVEGLKLYDKVEHLKQKLKLIENPLLRYVFGYQKYGSLQAKGLRPTGAKVIHVVPWTMTANLLHLLAREKLCPESCEDLEIQFHRDPLAAVNACYEGDRVIVCPGHYFVDGVFSIADSVELEGYGLPDDVVIEKQGKGDNFFDCTGANIKISNLKLVQHGAVEGILNVHHGKTTLENCVLQCETTGITVRTSAELLMKNSDLYGAKGAGVEIYPGSSCSLLHNGIHHCKEGILIKNFLDEDYEVPKITMVHNMIHNNDGYGVVLVRPAMPSETKDATGNTQPTQAGDETACAEGSRQEQPGCVTDELELCKRAETSEQTENNSEIANVLGATSAKKRQMHKKRLSELGFTEADDNLMSQEMFVSVEGNQFKWNGKGSFGLFFF